MIALIQRVLNANVMVDSQKIADINQGLLVFLGVEKTDTEENAKTLLNKVMNYRVFEDDQQKMNLSLLDIKASLLIVPQFTLAANTQRGSRPSFSSAAPPAIGLALYEHFVALAKTDIDKVETGKFGADMKVGLTNDGPVTFWLKK